jgi:AcrR family transcriptional regulator
VTLKGHENVMARTPGSTAEDTRARILRAAQELFVERGYVGTTIRDIAERLGMTKASLYYHFPAKQDVLDALIVPLLAGVDAIADTAREQRPVDREQAVRAFAHLIAGPGLSLGLLVADPSVLHEVKTRLDAPGRLANLTQALAAGGGEHDVLAARCALGVVHAGVTGTLLERSGHRAGLPCAPDRPVAAGEPRAALTDEELEQVVQAALAAWNVRRPAPARLPAAAPAGVP